MLPLYEEPQFTFRFAEGRLIPRFHLDGVPVGRRVAVFKIDPVTGARLSRLATATVGEDGWVDLRQPISVRAGDAFIAVPTSPPLIRHETSADHEGIRQVNLLAFGGDAEARLVESLRDGKHVRVSLVAVVEDEIVGDIRFSDLLIRGDVTTPALALAPLAVKPGHQNQGIGSELIRQGLETCKQAGHRIIIVVGHPHFYQRFGFSAERTSRLESPYSGESFMAAELVLGALDGVSGKVVYPPPFQQL